MFTVLPFAYGMVLLTVNDLWVNLHKFITQVMPKLEAVVDGT